MEELKLQEYYADEEETQISLKDYYRILYRGRWVILVSFVIVMIVTIFYTAFTPRVYQSTARIIVESKGTMERALFDITYMANQTTLISNQVEILKSRYLAENVVRFLESSPRRDSLTIFQPGEDGLVPGFRNQVQWIMSNLEVNPIKNTDVIEITFSAPSPWEARFICDAIAERYVELNREFNRQEFTELRRFLEQQIVKKGEELKLSEEALRAFKQREKLVSLDDETKELVSRYAEAEANIEQIQVELQALLETKRNLETQLEERKKALEVESIEVSSPLLAELQKEYARLVAEKVKYETLISLDRVDPQNFRKEVENMQQKIDAIQKKIKEESQKIAASSMVSDPMALTQQIISQLLDVENKIKASQATLRSYQEIAQQYEYRLSVLPEKALELARLERRLQVDQATYIMMNQKLEETRISEAGQKENVRILDYAIEPDAPVKPKVRINLILGVLLGLGLGVGLSFVLEYLDNSVKSVEELERTGMNVLATIPQIPVEELESKIAEVHSNSMNQEELDLLEGKRIETRLITHFDPKSPISEAYRTLRTNIQFSKAGKSIRSILITSSGPKEGKSTTVANLAITHAQLNASTVIVDTDLRRPVMHHIFGVEKDVGVTNYLVQNRSLKDVVKPTMVENLFLIPSGPLPPNPSELLASQKMKELIQNLLSEFDVVIFDSPPVIAVTDAQLIAAQVDGTVLVVKAEQTKREMLSRSVQLLKTVNANLLGYVFNSVILRKGLGYDYYYYYHYYEYYGSDLKRRKKGKFM